MNRKLLAFACLAAIAVSACKKPEPAEPAAAPAPAEQPLAVEPQADKNAAPAPFDIKGFAGSFKGTLPCADCPGIDTKLTLAADGSFKLDETYRDRKDGTSAIDGTWTVEADDRHIRLDPNSKSDNDRVYEILSGDEIRLLDQEGKRIEGDLPYSLKREAAGA